jgi:hypothetical protein
MRDGAAARQAGWAAAHAPRAAADLVMHKKKVEEVRGWLALQDAPPGQPARAPRLLLLTGARSKSPLLFSFCDLITRLRACPGWQFCVCVARRLTLLLHESYKGCLSRA